jgi:hypothetical protein
MGCCRALQREREQDRPAEDGAQHRHDERSQLLAGRPRNPLPHDQPDGEGAGDRRAARRRQERIESFDRDLGQGHREREENDPEQRPHKAFAARSHARK